MDASKQGTCCFLQNLVACFCGSTNLQLPLDDCEVFVEANLVQENLQKIGISSQGPRKPHPGLVPSRVILMPITWWFSGFASSSLETTQKKLGETLEGQHLVVYHVTRCLWWTPVFHQEQIEKQWKMTFPFGFFAYFQSLGAITSDAFWKPFRGSSKNLCFNVLYQDWIHFSQVFTHRNQQKLPF